MVEVVVIVVGMVVVVVMVVEGGMHLAPQWNTFWFKATVQKVYDCLLPVFSHDSFLFNFRSKSRGKNNKKQIVSNIAEALYIEDLKQSKSDRYMYLNGESRTPFIKSLLAASVPPPPPPHSRSRSGIRFLSSSSVTSNTAVNYRLITAQ